MTQKSNSQDLIHFTVTPQTQSARPGESIVFLLTTSNLSGTIQQQSFEIRGLPAAWYRTEFNSAAAFPGEQRSGTVTVSIPQGEPSGARTFQIRARGSAFSEDVDCTIQIQPPDLAATKDAPVRVRPAPAEAVIPPRLSLKPDGPFRLVRGQSSLVTALTIENISRLIERYEIRFEGIPATWVAASNLDVRLEPGGSTQVHLNFTPRTQTPYLAGEHPFTIAVTPLAFPAASSRIDAVLSIEGTQAFDAAIAPLQVSGRKGTFNATLTNTGDLPISFTIQTTDTQGLCKIRHQSPPTLQPGQTFVLPIVVGAKRNNLIGAGKVLPFQLRLQPLGAVASMAKTIDARLIHQPLLSMGVALAMSLLALIIGVIGAFLVLQPDLGQRQELVIGASTATVTSPTPPVVTPPVVVTVVTLPVVVTVVTPPVVVTVVTPPVVVTVVTPLPVLTFTKQAEGSWKLKSWTEAGGPTTLGIKVEAGSMTISSTADADWALDIDQVGQNRTPQPRIKCGGSLSPSKTIDAQPGSVRNGTARNGEENWTSGLRNIDGSSTGADHITRAMCGHTLLTRHPFTVALEGEPTKPATMMEMKNQFGTFVWIR